MCDAVKQKTLLEKAKNKRRTRAGYQAGNGTSVDVEEANGSIAGGRKPSGLVIREKGVSSPFEKRLSHGGFTSLLPTIVSPSCSGHPNAELETTPTNDTHTPSKKQLSAPRSGPLSKLSRASIGRFKLPFTQVEGTST